MAITHGIAHEGFRGFRRFEARKKGQYEFIGHYLVIPHDTIPSTPRSSESSLKK